MRIYGILDKNKNKIVYVGKTVNSDDFKPHGRHICKIIKNDPSRYDYIILENVQDANTLNEREQFFIVFYNTYNDNECFNFTPGGDGGYTLYKLTPTQRREIKHKELLTKKLNPHIMQQAAKKARETFALRPYEEQIQLHKQRIQKSIDAKQRKLKEMTEDEIKLRSLAISKRVKQIHNNRDKNTKEKIATKISNTLKKEKITLINIHTQESLSLCFSEWKKYYKVDVYHLTSTLQKTSHGWKLP